MTTPKKHPSRFVLEGVEPRTQLVATTTVFDIEDLELLGSIVDPAAKKFDLGRTYTLKPTDLRRLQSAFAISYSPGDLITQLRSWRPADDLPYKLHTNRELSMMLAGLKPLAYFSELYPIDSARQILGLDRFASHVKSGRFLMREYTLLRNHLKQPADNLYVALFALPSESWRLDAFILVQITAEKVGWNEGFERMMGSLLGYEEWQNDAYVERFHRV